MSAEAIAYVATLLRCADGAPLTCTQKCVLFCLADHHNRSTHRCDPSLHLLVTESLTSKDTVQRALAYLERHAVLQITRPINQGRGKCCSYAFLALAEPQVFTQQLPDPDKGEHSRPIFTPRKGEQKGSIHTDKGEQKGSNGYIANKEEPLTVEPKNQGQARASARAPIISQSERDSLDLKRWRAEMQRTEGTMHDNCGDSDAQWRVRARQAAYLAGVSPARLLELLRQHFPTDSNLYLLYPELNKRSKQPEMSARP